MNTNYSFLGTKTFIRRLFKQDIENVISCYTEFDTLYHNPMSPAFANDLLLYGELWGAFVQDKFVGCCYFFNAGSDFFKQYGLYQGLQDFVDNMKNYTYLGYIYADKSYNTTDIYQAFYNLVQLQAFRNGTKYILHSVPIKISDSIQLLFNSSFKLIRMRGLENLVVHYIFVKPIFAGDTLYSVQESTSQPVQLENTKALSKFLEHGHCGVDLIHDNESLIVQLKKLNNL